MGLPNTDRMLYNKSKSCIDIYLNAIHKFITIRLWLNVALTHQMMVFRDRESMEGVRNQKQMRGNNLESSNKDKIISLIKKDWR